MDDGLNDDRLGATGRLGRVTDSLMRCLDLFSGMGGISRALRNYCRTVAWCECAEFPRKIIEARMADGLLDRAPLFSDVRELSAEKLREAGVSDVDIICGGFPCQDISTAGNQRGMVANETRSGLFFEIIRLAHELHPQYIFLENVSAITSLGNTLGIVLSSLDEIGCFFVITTCS